MTVALMRAYRRIHLAWCIRSSEAMEETSRAIREGKALGAGPAHSAMTCWRAQEFARFWHGSFVYFGGHRRTREAGATGQD